MTLVEKLNWPRPLRKQDLSVYYFGVPKEIAKGHLLDPSDSLLIR